MLCLVRRCLLSLKADELYPVHDISHLSFNAYLVRSHAICRAALIYTYIQANAVEMEVKRTMKRWLHTITFL